MHPDNYPSALGGYPLCLKAFFLDVAQNGPNFILGPREKLSPEWESGVLDVAKRHPEAYGLALNFLHGEGDFYQRYHDKMGRIASIALRVQLELRDKAAKAAAGEAA